MNVRLQYPIQFTAGVYYDGDLRMNTYHGRLWLITNTMDPANHNISYERLKYFVYNELDSTVFINSDHREQCLKYVSAGVKITTMPGEPVDQLVGIMLFYKLNAIMEGRMSVLETELSSVLGDGMIYMHAENENTDLISRPTWWDEPDLIHYDSDLVSTDKIVDMHKGGAWRELDLAWPETSTSDSTGNIVFADFGRNETK